MDAEKILAEDAPLLEAPHAFGHFQPPITGGEVGEGLGLDRGEDLRLLLGEGPRIIVHLRLLRPDFPLPLVEVGDQVGFGPVEIDGPGVAFAENPRDADLCR